jgi:hypothetical protein
MAGMAGDEAGSRRWQAAVDLIAVWWTTREESRPAVLARRLAELTAGGSSLTVEETALALADVAGMFAELYADRMGVPLDEILAEAALLGDAGAGDSSG